MPTNSKLLSSALVPTGKRKEDLVEEKIDETILSLLGLTDVFDFKEENQMDQSFALIATCIDKIYSEEEVWATADCTKKELMDFLDQMNTMQFKLIEKFFETMPKLSHTVKLKNPETKVESEVVIEGLASFFG